MKKIIILLFFLILTTFLYAQKNNVFYHTVVAEKDVKKLGILFHTSRLNLGIDLDMKSSRDIHLKNYKVKIGYGKHNIEGVSFVPYIMLGYRRMGDEYGLKSLSRAFKYSNHYAGIGFGLYRNLGRFNFGFTSDLSLFKHKLEFGEAVLDDAGKVDFSFSGYVGYELSRHLIVFAEAKYNHYNFMVMNGRSKHYYFTGLGIAYKLKAH